MELGSAEAEPTWAGRLARTPFAAALAKGAPFLVASGDPPHVEFATSATLAAFGVADAAALNEALFASESLGSRRLLRLSSELAADGPARLELLRFFVDRRPVSVFWLCGRIRSDDETYFVAADPAGLEQGVDSAQHDALAEDEADTEEPPVRFVWRLDRDGRCGLTDPKLREQLGAEAPREGETLDALAARLRLGPEWTSHVNARKTFSGLPLAWPEPHGEFARIVRISGAPQFGGADRYEGFRGFGLITDERVKSPRPAAPPAAATRANELPRLLVKPGAPGDAAALISLLQRQHAPANIAVPSANVNAPALAIISALANLLAPKAAGASAAAAPLAKGAETPPSGAEIVVLRPHAALEPIAAEARPSDNVSLSSQERAAFKEIARALGAKVRDSRPAPEPPGGAPSARERPDEPKPDAPAADAPAHDDLAALLDNLPIAALLMRDGDPLYANRTLLDLTGYRDLADFRAREGLKAIFRSRDPQSLAPGGTVVGIPLVASGERLLTVDAQVRPAVWRGAPASLIAMRRSREAEHQAEMRAIEREIAMHAARARDFAVALDAARDGMVRLDRGGRILGMNGGAEALSGYAQNEVAGDNFLSLFATACHEAITASLEKLARGEVGPVESVDAVARHREGREFPVRLDLGRLANQPEPDFFLLFTNLKNVESSPSETDAALEEAENASAAKTELLSRVSHEMRTPLHAIMGFAEVILEERFGPIGNERYRDYIKDIHASGRHVLSLANDLLDLTKLQLGKIDLQFAPLDVNGVIRECVTLMQPQAARERIIMRLSLFDRLPNVMADERSLRQIMLNLITNAIKYNEPGGQVIVSSAIDDAGAVLVRVRDTGVGMNENELAIALEPFRRVPGGKAVEGAGLGLPLTKALVEANHADFSIKSRKDQGTLVEIAFPVQHAAQ